MDYIPFFAAKHRLRCEGSWLSEQIDRGKVRYRLESMNDGTFRYLLCLDDVKNLFPPTRPHPKSPPIEPFVSKSRQVIRRVELIVEASALGMTVEEYMREMEIRLD